jgi:hypothetical protein
MKRIILSCILWFVPITLAMAEQGFGNVAENLLTPVIVVSDFVNTASIIVGISFIFGGFLRYLQHRVNPLAVPISTVVLLEVMGVFLVCLPLAYKLSEGGIPYSFKL